MMIQVTPEIAIDETALQWEFVRASGPGGQNVNKVASAVLLRFDAGGSGLPTEVEARLRRLAGSRMTSDGVLQIRAQRFRTQERNREDALERLIELVARAAVPPKPRKKTKPSRAAVERRLESKKRQSDTKRRRRVISSDH